MAWSVRFPHSGLDSTGFFRPGSGFDPIQIVLGGSGARCQDSSCHPTNTKSPGLAVPISGVQTARFSTKPVATASSWRTCPKVKERRFRAQGPGPRARSRELKSRFIPPWHKTTMSSIESAPAAIPSARAAAFTRCSRSCRRAQWVAFRPHAGLWSSRGPARRRKISQRSECTNPVCATCPQVLHRSLASAAEGDSNLTGSCLAEAHRSIGSKERPGSGRRVQVVPGPNDPTRL